MSQMLLRLPFAASLLALAACGGKSSDEPAGVRGETIPPPSEWVEPNPTEPAVPVELPKSPMGNVPVEKATPAAK